MLRRGWSAIAALSLRGYRVALPTSSLPHRHHSYLTTLEEAEIHYCPIPSTYSSRDQCGALFFHYQYNLGRTGGFRARPSLPN